MSPTNNLFRDGMFANPRRYRLSAGVRVPHTFRVEGDGHDVTKVFLDDKELHVMAIDMHIEAREVPIVRLTFFSQVELPSDWVIEPMDLSIDVQYPEEKW